MSACSPGTQIEESADFFYLGFDEAGASQIFHHKSQGESLQTTQFDKGVFDYALSPDGRRLVLSVIKEDGSGLWIMDNDGSSLSHIYACPTAECANFAWAADSRRLLFEKRLKDENNAAGTPTLWWLDTQTAEVISLASDERSYGANANLAPDGRWLSYHSPEQGGANFYNLADGRSQFIFNEIGAAAAWSPDGTEAVLPLVELVIIHGGEGEDHDAHAHDYQTAVHLTLVNPESGERQNISGDLAVEDSVPAWSPDGRWIAFGRRAPRTGAGRQLWIMRADGSDARELTGDPAVNHGPPAWSADGRYLLFQQVDQGDATAEPGIWRIDVKTGGKEPLVTHGMQPAWAR